MPRSCVCVGVGGGRELRSELAMTWVLQALPSGERIPSLVFQLYENSVYIRLHLRLLWKTRHPNSVAE